MQQNHKQRRRETNKTNKEQGEEMTDILTQQQHRHFSPDMLESVTPDILESDSYSVRGLSPPLFISSNNITNSDSEGSGMVSSPANLSGGSHVSAEDGSVHLSVEFEDLVIRREKMRLRGEQLEGGEQDDNEQLSMLELVIATLRKSLLTCKTSEEEAATMDISWPTNVRHVTHVTFDRFNGFLGLPMEFEIEIPCRVPSASASVFGVSPESMQCSFDPKGNSVPTILLLMQERLYSQGGLKVEGIFRINAENSHEEIVREQLNRGIVPYDIDLHCLAGLIKAWFRELPKGVLDSLTPDQVMQCHTEEQCVELVKLLPPTQAALLDWAINLMADVAQEEASNKMNARNIAMVFAPNMTQMADPLTALMHAVQVMNILKTLILRTVRDRQEAILDTGAATSLPHNKDKDDDQCVASGGISEEKSEDTKEYETEYLHQSNNHHNNHHHHYHRLKHGKPKIMRSSPRLINRIDKQSERAEAW